MDLDYKSIGKRLQEARKTNNLTQQALADALGVSVSYIKNTEGGKKPSLEYLFLATKLCLVSFDWILTGKESSTQQKNEVIFDSDLKMMIDVLKELMSSDDPDLRGWAKIQFKSAFKEHCTMQEAEKKLHA